MSETETIPGDIMEAATEIVDRIAKVHIWKGDCVADVARAIMAAADRQRETDAQIALAIIPEGGAHLVDPRRDHAHAIAAAIRQSKEPVEP